MKMCTYPQNEGTPYYGDITNVQLKIKQAEITKPNLFTHNNEGVAECFVIEGLEELADSNLYVVNRLGQEVYKSRKYKNDWNAEGLVDGNYYYLLMIKESVNSEWKTIKGYVTLISLDK